MRMIGFPVGQTPFLLPAVGEFTGPHLIRLALGDRIGPIARDYLVSIPISQLQPLE
jgi:hypothetical protein